MPTEVPNKTRYSIASSFNSTVLDIKTPEQFSLTSEKNYSSTTITSASLSSINTKNYTTISYPYLDDATSEFYETNSTINFTGRSETLSGETSMKPISSSSSTKTSTDRSQTISNFKSSSQKNFETKPSFTNNMSYNSVFSTVPITKTTNAILPTLTTNKTNEQTFTSQKTTSKNAISSTNSVFQSTTSEGSRFSSTSTLINTSTIYTKQTSTRAPTIQTTSTSKFTQSKTSQQSTTTAVNFVSATSEKTYFSSTDVSLVL